MDRAQQRYERFAQLRAASPGADYDEIWMRIHDEEVEADEAAEGRRIAAMDEELRYSDADAEGFMERAFAAGNL